MSDRRRPVFALAALAALAVTVVFATIGDGVDVPGATGLRRRVVEHGHTLVWALLTVAFAAAAVHGRWTRFANAVALAALGCYLAFLLALVTG